ncbi:PilZ domain-containing protein [Azohydromonas caseinilytica]|nr:PilZ domain-containing protein [Azohydromonas caseinilytica]
METRDIASWVYSGAERRRTERKVLRGSAQLLLPSGNLVETRLVDISQGGLGLVAPVNLPVGTVCEVKFRSALFGNGTEALVVRGRIARSILSGKEGGFMIGLEFSNLAPALRDKIKRYVTP